MSRSVAINVAANTTLPGFRGPLRPDGSFSYVPIPEREPTRERVPTYGDLADATDLGVDIPPRLADTPVHLDPEFAGYPFCERNTYGDEHGVKAKPLSTLAPGDSLLFYATLSLEGDAEAAAPWIPPEWGAYLIGEFRVERVMTGEAYRAAPPERRAVFENNAHVKRDSFDARVLVAGDGTGGRFDRAVPLSEAASGATANRLVTELSSDSGKGPWWRRPLRFDDDATRELRELLRDWPESASRLA